MTTNTSPTLRATLLRLMISFSVLVSIAIGLASLSESETAGSSGLPTDAPADTPGQR